MRPHVEFMSSSRSPYAKPSRNLTPAKGDPWLFWWTIAIFILLALTTISWLSSLYIFRHPEKPRNYRLLAQFHKLEPLKKFTERNVPQGKFHTAKEIYAKYFTYTDEELDTLNNLFKRSYIRNYADDTPVYLRGKYRVYKVEELTPQQPFMSGLVVRAKSVELPNVSIEFVFPTEALPKERPAYGDDLVLDTNDTFGSAVHISRLPEDSLCVTLVPLTYYSFHPSDPKRTLVLSPPHRLNMDAPWPLTDDTPMPDAEPVKMAVTPGAGAAAEGSN